MWIENEKLFVIPALHNTMESAQEVARLIDQIRPDCIACELPETLSAELFQAISRLPSLTLMKIGRTTGKEDALLVEPADPFFEALRRGMDMGAAIFAIDLDVENYGDFSDLHFDPYLLSRLGLMEYLEWFQKIPIPKTQLDNHRELHMARRLKELSFSYERIVFVTGMAHFHGIREGLSRSSFPVFCPQEVTGIRLLAPNEESIAEILGEAGFISTLYEKTRGEFLLDRHKEIVSIVQETFAEYREKRNPALSLYLLRVLLTYAKNYAFVTGSLLPSLFQLITAAKGVVGPNFAYDLWKKATHYPYLANPDNLEEVEVTCEELWPASKKIHFPLKKMTSKGFFQRRQEREASNQPFRPPSSFSICSWPPEDKIVEGFGQFLQKKGSSLVREEEGHIEPFSTSLEDGISIKETLRHFYERKIYVKKRGRQHKGVGSVVVIFDEKDQEKYPYTTVWLGEHNQESDMAFFATDPRGHVVGPGISRCQYGGFLMSYPPLRLGNIWSDPDYSHYENRSDVLLHAALDYSLKPLIVYVNTTPPSPALKKAASQMGKKIVFVPRGELSPLLLRKMSFFHLMEGKGSRLWGGKYIEEIEP